MTEHYTPPRLEAVAHFRALHAAALRAARGHKSSLAVAAFLVEVESQILQLERELLTRTYRPQPYYTFRIRDPKPRTISAAAFRDRVVHHALCTALEPCLERRAVGASFACRPGRGLKKALMQTQRLAQRHRFVLKLDIQHFFERAHQGVLQRMLWHAVRDEGIRWLLRVFLETGAPGSAKGRGLPIGNLTSQHFANFYLGSLDRYLLRGLRVPGLVRYMDDILIFADDKDSLHQWQRSADVFVRSQLRLTLKPEATRLLPVHQGVPYLGFVVFPRTIRFDPVRARRWRRKMRMLNHAVAKEELLMAQAQRSASSLEGWARHGDTFTFRQSFQRRFWQDAEIRAV